MGSGNYFYPLNREFLNLSGGTVTGDTLFTANLSATTIFSGSTNLGDLLNSVVSGGTKVINGINTFTSGTIVNTSVNITGGSFNNLFTSGITQFFQASATTLSGGTIFSASTDVYDIFVNKVNAGSNVSISGTSISPIVNVVESPSFNNINYSGTSVGGNSISTNVSATTFYSGSTNLQNVIQNMITGVTTGVTSTIQNGLNTYTGGTGFLPTINVSALTIDNINVSGTSVFTGGLSANTLSGGTIYSGNTDVSLLFATPQNISLINSQLTTKANLSGATFIGGIISPSLSATTLSGGTIYSGATELSLIINSQITGITSGLINTHVQNGLNTYTGGTADLPTVNISALTINTLTASGTSVFSNGLSANTLSGGTILSGSTNLYSIFVTSGSLIPTYVQNGLNTYTGGTISNPTVNVSALTINTLTASGTSVFSNGLSANTLSGGTIYSGATELSLIINSQITGVTSNLTSTRVQNGLNTYTGGTPDLPTVNVSALTINTLSASGNSQLTSVTANTITISGNSDVSELLVIANSTQTKPLITLLKSDNTELLRIHSNTLENTFLGFSAGTSISSGLFNTFLGSGAGTGTTTGGVNVFVGHQAGSVITGGTSNVFIGAGAGKIKQSGDFNVYIGANAGGNTMAGNNNVYIGDWAGRFNYSGANNTYIGQASGYLSSGNSNVFLGFGAGVSVSGSNLLYIANSSTPNPLIFGNFSTSEVKINGTLSALTLSATSIYANVEISPIIDNNTDIGSSVKRFRSLNIVSGVSVSFTSTTRVTTPEIRLGNVLVYENNIVLTGDTIGGTVGGDDW